MSKKKRPTQIADSTFDSGTRAVEDIHRSISDLPFQILENLGIMDKSATEVKKVHDESLAAVYATVRDVGHKVIHFAEETGRELVQPTRPERKTTGRPERQGAARAA